MLKRLSAYEADNPPQYAPRCHTGTLGALSRPPQLNSRCNMFDKTHVPSNEKCSQYSSVTSRFFSFPRFPRRVVQRPSPHFWRQASAHSFHIQLFSMPIVYNGFSRLASRGKGISRPLVRDVGHAPLRGNNRFFGRVDNYPLKRFIARSPFLGGFSSRNLSISMSRPASVYDFRE